MLVYQDLLSGKDVGTDSYPAKLLAGGAVIAMESKKISVGVDEDAIAKATGANDSKEEGAEATGDKAESTAEMKINIVHAHDLQKVDITKKEFGTMMRAYWGDVKKTMDAAKYDALGLGKEYKPPADKKAAADAEKEAEGKLSKFDKQAVVNAQKKLDQFKKNFPAITEFLTKEILAKFETCDFYLPGDGAELGKCMIIPACYVGEATTPTFFYYVDGLIENKF
jgi:hypothetical protein